MVNFLKKMRSELLEEKLKLEAEQSNITNRISRNEKFLQKLREEEELTYDAFSPRRRNIKLQDHIRSLEEEQAVLLQNSKTAENHLFHLDSRLNELDQAIKAIRKQEAVVDVKKTEKMKEKELYTFLNKNLKGMLQKTDLCTKLLKVDPNRCLLELSVVRKMLQEVQELLVDVNDSGRNEEAMDGSN